MGVMVFGCGRSWPGGFESGRFSWLHLPATVEEVDSFVEHLRGVDEWEHDLLRQWSDEGESFSPDPRGIDASVADYPGSMDDLTALAAFTETLPRAGVLAMADVGSAAEMTAALEGLGHLR